MTKALITGIGGSIGIHVMAHVMHNTNWDVVGIDSFKHHGLTDRINVMYAGFIVETATTGDLFDAPSHPYTVGLLHSMPRVDDREGEPLIPIEGRPPDMRNAPTGCPFAPRCAWRLDRCSAEDPPLTAHEGRPDQRFACHNPVTPAEVEVGRPLRAAAAGAGA